VGVAQTYSIENAEALHHATFADIESSVPTDVFAELTTSSDYRIAIAASPVQFVQQLPFYTTKPLYPVLMTAVANFGTTLTAASVIVSRAAYCLVGVLCLLWLSRHYGPLAAAVATALLVSTPIVLDLSRFSTPDALSTLVLLGGTFLLLESRLPRVALAVLVLSILVRPDNVLFVVTLAAIGLLRWDRARGTWATAIVLAGLVYSALSAYSGDYGWPTLLYHGFVERLLEPATAEVEIGTLDYLAILARGSHPVVMNRLSYSFLLFVLLNLVTLRLAATSGSTGGAHTDVLAAVLVYSGLHWLAFPSQKERLLAACFVIVVLMLLVETQRIYAAHRRAQGRQPT
jgi:hypothetical protein